MAKKRKFDHDECRRLYHEEDGWTQEALAEHFNVSKITIWRVLNGNLNKDREYKLAWSRRRRADPKYRAREAENARKRYRAKKLGDAPTGATKEGI